MLTEATLIYPHHLFKKHPALKAGRRIFIIEDYLFFGQYSFHKNKIVLHRASMKAYKERLESDGYQVTYLDYKSNLSIEKVLSSEKITKVWLAELDDDWLSQRLQDNLCKVNIQIEFMPSPLFLTPLKWSLNFYSEKKPYLQTAFYIAQRKRLNILLDKEKKPIGSSWTFDTDNRNKLPTKFIFPESPKIQNSLFIQEALAYVNQKFQDNPGKTFQFVYPVTHEDAEVFFGQFLKFKLQNFGDYQDALTTRDQFVFHSILSPLINTGLLSPDFVVKRTLKFAEDNRIPLNSLEGFIRQIIGWREFFRVIYKLESRKQRTQNYWSFSRKIPKSFWSATTGIIPVDSVISKVLDTSYAHHIERLMVLGNFMLLCEFDPDEVYRWFMELFIDSYDWVMVPNVYGMSQYADGGLITTKPYISSSNYIKKMGDYPDGDWNEIWDGLYWHFIWKQQTRLKNNFRMSMMITQLNKMDSNKLNSHLRVAKNYLASIDP